MYLIFVLSQGKYYLQTNMHLGLLAKRLSIISLIFTCISVDCNCSVLHRLEIPNDLVWAPIIGFHFQWGPYLWLLSYKYVYCMIHHTYYNIYLCLHNSFWEWYSWIILNKLIVIRLVIWITSLMEIKFSLLCFT